jgi:hypothetical protein
MTKNVMDSFTNAPVFILFLLEKMQDALWCLSQISIVSHDIKWRK